MKPCLAKCQELDVSCPVKDCRNWIDYPDEYNCILETVDCNGNMTLRQVAERLGISFVRVKQIEDKSLKKIGHLLKDEAI
tara:strand:- start:225 stop:464 length:240 start_codon:yes stop_codon:yes gene_type:complete